MQNQNGITVSRRSSFSRVTEPETPPPQYSLQQHRYAVRTSTMGSSQSVEPGHTKISRFHVMTRWVSKQVKRWAFLQGRVFTRHYMKHYMRKYLLKYLKKNNKLAKSNVWSIEVHEDLADLLVYTLTREAKTTEAILYSASLKYLETQNLPEPINLKRVQDLSQYALGLGQSVDNNIGLSHSKVREYWLRRGPRQFGTYLFLLAFSLGTAELRGYTSRADQVWTIIVATMAMVIGVYMLYYRLPDSLDGSIMRSAHDFYVRRKVILRAEGFDVFESEAITNKENNVVPASASGSGDNTTDAGLKITALAIDTTHQSSNLSTPPASPPPPRSDSPVPAPHTKPSTDRSAFWREETVLFESKHASGGSASSGGGGSPMRNKYKTRKESELNSGSGDSRV